MEVLKQFFIITIIWALLMMASHVTFHFETGHGDSMAAAVAATTGTVPSVRTEGQGYKVEGATKTKMADQSHSAHTWLRKAREESTKGTRDRKDRGVNGDDKRKQALDAEKRMRQKLLDERDAMYRIAHYKKTNPSVGDQRQRETQRHTGNQTQQDEKVFPVKALPPHRATTPEQKIDEKLHIVFSTDCSAYQDWQSLVVFHSAYQVKQLGKITRIASGCDAAKKIKLMQLYDRLWPQYGVHFTRDFTKTTTGEKYEFYNKPYGLLDFLDNNSAVEKDAIIAIIDPDFIFLRPLTRYVKGQQANLIHAVRHRFPPKEFDYIDKGRPVAQLYGLGAPWTDDHHKKFNRTRICGVGSPCLEVNDDEGRQHYAVGPPYILHRDDIHRLAKTWTSIVPKVYEGYPFLLAEMYAYSMAAAHEKLPHLTFRNHMVSNTDSGDDEAWQHVSALGMDVCEDPVNGIFYPGKLLPSFVHYCQWFRMTDIGFQKRRVTNQQPFTCDGPLMVDIPRNISHETWVELDEGKVRWKQQRINRNVFGLCVIHKAINMAVVDYKERMCTDPDHPPTFRKVLNGLRNEAWEKPIKD